MRTKQLLWTVALPALFAACTSEDVFEAQNAEVSALAGRKAVEGITFTMDDADTRLTFDKATYGKEVGDAFGACLVDVPNGANADDPVKNYNLAANVQSNYKYTFDGSNWTSDAALVEGNYIFYAPYDKSHLSRNGFDVVTPITQTLTATDGEVDPWSAVEAVLKDKKTPFFIGYSFLEAGREGAPQISWKQLFATPKFTIKNEQSTAVKITKVAISAVEQFNIKGQLDLASGKDANAEAGNGVVGKLFNAVTPELDKDGKSQWGAWVETKTDKNHLEIKSSDLITWSSSTTPVIVMEVEGGWTLEAGESASFFAVVPGEATGQLTLKIYTDDEYGWSEKCAETTNKTTLIPGQIYTRQDFYDDGSNKKPIAGQILSTAIPADEKATKIGNDEVPYIVTSQEDFTTVH